MQAGLRKGVVGGGVLVEEPDVRRVKQRLDVLKPVRLVIRCTRPCMFASEMIECEIRELNGLAVPEVDPDNATGFANRISVILYLRTESLIFLRRHPCAVPVSIECPSVKDTGESIVLVATEGERDATVGAGLVQKSYTAIVATKRDIFFAQQLDPRRSAIAL
ncbi:hypothetical protein PT2222_460025 [Paraburkholderia tropica]